jgi:hypothetical protein
MRGILYLCFFNMSIYLLGLDGDTEGVFKDGPLRESGTT